MIPEFSDEDLKRLKQVLAVSEDPLLTPLVARLTRVEAERDNLRGQIEGTDHLAADPSKWGLRAMLDGVCGQRDSEAAEKDKFRLVLETIQKRINFVFGTTQNRSWETFLFELREGISQVLVRSRDEAFVELEQRKMREAGPKVLDFLEKFLDQMFKCPAMFGDQCALETQTLLLLEIRCLILEPSKFEENRRIVNERWSQFLGGGSNPLFARGLSEEAFVSKLAAFRDSVASGL